MWFTYLRDLIVTPWDNPNKVTKKLFNQWLTWKKRGFRPWKSQYIFYAYDYDYGFKLAEQMIRTRVLPPFKARRDSMYTEKCGAGFGTEWAGLLGNMLKYL